MRVVQVLPIAALSCALLSGIAIEAQQWSVPRTEAGHPDLQGYWINNKNIVFERPVELGDKRFYTETEAQALIDAAIEQQSARESPADPNRPAPPAGEIISNVADENFHPELYTQQAVVDGEYRTSIIIDPPNGRIAYREGATDIHGQWLADGFGQFDGPESRTAAERCLNYPGQLPLIVQIPPEDSKTLQILQTKDYVLLNAEYNTGLRAVPLHQEQRKISWPQWLGTATGRWQGDSLVVHSKGFRPEQSHRRILSSGELEITEVYTLVSEDELLYRFTYQDPVTLAQPFTGEIPLARMDEGQRIYESACHEGNYSIVGVLAGARRQEADEDK
ncbi:MAG: hypothetical protein WDZ52_09305 [Pseudohongiellaceae bacterium]